MISGDSKDLDRLERALRASLRPVDPGATFTAALQTRIASIGPHSLRAGDGPDRPHRRLHSTLMALAASSVVALAVGWQLRDLQAGPDIARSGSDRPPVQMQVLLALEITSERLVLAQQRIEQYQSQEIGL